VQAGSLGHVADDQASRDDVSGDGITKPAYDWLYAEQYGSEGQPGSNGQSGSDDPEATQLIRRDRSAGDAVSAGEAASPGEPEATREFRYAHDPQPPTEQPATSGDTATADETRYQPPPGQRPTTMPEASPPPRRRRRWWLRIVLLLVLACILFLVLVPIAAWTKVSKVNAEPAGNRPSSTPGTTYLLVGSDSRRGLTASQNQDLGTGGVAVDNGRTDTIMLMHVPSGGGPTLLLSIPRDSFVSIPGFGQNKINAAFSLGGPRLLVRTVESATGVRVDDYVEIGFTGFVKLVNAVGGVTICPNQPINDPKADLQVRKGCQHADGKTALGYSRSRAFPLGDITRAEHQREVVNATAKKAASWQTVVLPWRYWKINFAGAESVRVGLNVGPVAMAKFAWAMAHSNEGKKCIVPYTSLGASTSAGSAVLWDTARARVLFQQIRNDNTKAIRCKLH
jgi:LCP family protein required for cell wall assembly